MFKSLSLPPFKLAWGAPSGTGLRTFHSSASAQASRKAQRKLASTEKKKRNLALQASKKSQGNTVDPVLGRQNNPFINRIKLEIDEPNVLARKLELHEVDKLLFGAKESKILKSVSTLGYDEATVSKIEQEEAEKRDVLLRILNLRNADNTEKQNRLVELALKEFARFEGDTGSSEVQAAVMTVKLYNLMEHIKQHPQDLVHIRKARMLTQQRQRLLRYLKRDNPERYFWAIEKLGLTDDNVHMEFNFDKKYMEEFNIWPGRKLVKVTEKENEERRKLKRLLVKERSLRSKVVEEAQ